jgi:hypothetical protein
MAIDFDEIADVGLTNLGNLESRKEAVEALSIILRSVHKHGQRIGVAGFSMEIERAYKKIDTLIEYGVLEDEVRENSESSEGSKS